MTAETGQKTTISEAQPIAPIIVTTADLRAVGYCFAGVLPWFARHGFDCQGFIEQGISADLLRATGDAPIEPVIRAAELRAAQGRSAD